jgi:aryl-alcohol dehydrogenase-like predicted oxidoreductase
MHQPDVSTPIEETLGALNELVVAGKVRYIGSSNYSAEQIEEAESVARERGFARYVSAQNHYSFVVRATEDEILPTCARLGIGQLPFFPLASGLLTGKYQRGAPAPEDTRFSKAPGLRDRYVTPRNEEVVEKLQAFAKARGHSLLELAFSWLGARPQVASVIAGATRVEQIEQNVHAIGWNLGAEEMAEVDRITKG